MQRTLGFPSLHEDGQPHRRVLVVMDQAQPPRCIRDTTALQHHEPFSPQQVQIFKVILLVYRCACMKERSTRYQHLQDVVCNLTLGTTISAFLHRFAAFGNGQCASFCCALLNRVLVLAHQQ